MKEIREWVEEFKKELDLPIHHDPQLLIDEIKKCFTRIIEKLCDVVEADDSLSPTKMKKARQALTKFMEEVKR